MTKARLGRAEQRPSRLMDWTCPDCRQRFTRRNASHSCAVQDVDELFAAYPQALPIVAAVRKVVNRFGTVGMAATKTQVSFRARTRFAWIWIPAMALRRGPADVFLTIALRKPVKSPRIKQVVEPSPGRFMHHLLLANAKAVDKQVTEWLETAYEAAT